MRDNNVTILLVDDDEIDRELLVRALRKANIINPVRTAVDGVQGLEILRGENGQEKIRRPYIIVLDWNMPRMSGAEFLYTIRDDKKLSDSIVFVLTTSSAQRDKLEAYDYNVAGFIVKDRAGKDFLELIQMLDRYWQVVDLPT